ncbi:MAG: iron-sulfur cluster insertion protein ErpA [Acidimicrobiaceae bacterium]|nr:iron-sulfur cluster insertion protein ErpA [Acidimicrobiaceae bacterium]MYE96371.1 iron-sulfur cluster insertion protein ErpA [Acidimicrobiaceae bacterium]MYI53255.1 iron-sulfur cluster insertion protein ErpA [Acidimicrobiaceae bacterium]
MLPAPPAAPIRPVADPAGFCISSLARIRALGLSSQQALGNHSRRAVVITLTDKASDKVSELIEAENEEGLSLRVAVRPGGCSGFSYEMYFDTDVADSDTTATFGAVQVVVDPSSAMLLEGATLDYSDSLQSAGFSIDNPNAQRTCGCGQSFS